MPLDPTTSGGNVDWSIEATFLDELKTKATILTKRPNHHYDDVTMGVIASQITSLTIVYSIVYSDTDQRKRQSSASLAFVRGIHRGPVSSPHKWPVMRKIFPFYDVIMPRTKYCACWSPCFVKCHYIVVIVLNDFWSVYINNPKWYFNMPYMISMIFVRKSSQHLLRLTTRVANSLSTPLIPYIKIELIEHICILGVRRWIYDTIRTSGIWVARASLNLSGCQ